MRRLFVISTLVSVSLLVLASSAHAVELFVGDNVPFNANSTPTGNLPVLFVHGHNTGNEGNDPNYRKNWLLRFDGLPSFAAAITQNSSFGFEPYYIRFSDQDHSIVEDARDIRDAVNLILERHDQNFDHTNASSTTSVKVVIIAYSKGTISTRIYLKSLQGAVPDIPAPLQSKFHPVSEFIAIAPPNHGINISGLAGLLTASGQGLLNGFRPDCSSFIVQRAPQNFIADLNGHPIADTQSLETCEFYASEAPGSRSAIQPPDDGVLYVTLFANNNRDFVGGDTPSNDCQGRRLALNLSPNAVNIPVPTIAGNDSIEVHQNTVHTPEVICKALYAAARHRSPVGQTCSTVNVTVDNVSVPVPVLPDPSRAAAMLTLDFSGSMSLPSCPNCTTTRADELKRAVNLFVDLWRAVSVPTDRLGVTYFRTDIDPFAVAGERTPLLSVGGDPIIADVIRLTQTPHHLTAMGGGLQSAIDTLKGVPADSRHVILFTDGMQNVNPMVLRANPPPPSGDCFFIDNEPNRPNSNVGPTTPPTVLNPSLGIIVDTIGIGAGQSFVGMLQDITNNTGGRSWASVDTTDLNRFFNEELIFTLQNFSPQLVDYRQHVLGANGATEDFVIEDGARKLVLELNWKDGPPLDFSVAKDGNDVTSAGKFIKGTFHRLFVIDLPAKGIIARGNWQMRIKGGSGSRAYEAAAIIDGERIKYDARLTGVRPDLGDIVDLVVRLKVDGRPIREAEVTIDWKSPRTTVGDLIAKFKPTELPNLEPGASRTERQILALAQNPKALLELQPKIQRFSLKANNKGEFRKRFKPGIAGVYTAMVTIEGEDKKLGKYRRTTTATTIVRFAKARIKDRDISGRETVAPNALRNVSVIVKPRDQNGRLMGPGLSTNLKWTVSTGQQVGKLNDLGDGRYELMLLLKPGEDPTIDLEVAGGPKFSRSLSRIVRK